MQVIHLHHPYDQNSLSNDAVVLAMGFFDGVHVGHRAVIARAKEEANRRNLKLAVLTYDQHASIVFAAHERPVTYLTTETRKLELFDELGVDITYVVSFTSAVGHLAPQDFVDQYMYGLHAKVVVAGFDHTYGPKSTANMAQLPNYAAGRFDVIEVASVRCDGVESSSTNARQLVDTGQITALNRLLQTTYQTTGVIVHGEARGREMGYPTANIETTPGERLPGGGIYAVELGIAGVWYPGMASIGSNVTFGDNRPITVEINLFDFHQEIYGEHVKVRWHQYLRSEVKFTGMDALIEQLADDEQHVRQFFMTYYNKEA